MATAKGQAIADYAASKVGCAYIYGGYGEKKCTPAFRKERASAYPAQKNNIYSTCPVLSGKQGSCKGCKYDGKQAYDCAQLTRYACKAAGQELVSGANSQWNKTEWAAKGPISTLPDEPGVLLYHDNGSGVKTHTGVSQGGGRCVEARNAKNGVVNTAVAERTWTHWAALPGVLSEAPPAGSTETPAAKPSTIRKGDRGASVVEAQKLLLAHGYELPKYGADGDFGDETLKAVLAFQNDKRLVVDGLVGTRTWAALRAEPSKQPVYTVRISGLTSAKADEIIAKYGGVKEV